MVIFLIFLTILAFVALFIYQGEKTVGTTQEPQQSKPASQPVHFELMDDNGEQLPKHRQPIEQPKIQRLRYFCIKDKGYHISVWPKDQGIGDCLQFPIAGLTHVDDIADYLGELVATLETDPTNPYDANAIKIVAHDGHRIGFVPKDQTKFVRDFTSLPCKCYCFIGTSNDTYFSCCYITNRN